MINPNDPNSQFTDPASPLFDPNYGNNTQGNYNLSLDPFAQPIGTAPNPSTNSVPLSNKTPGTSNFGSTPDDPTNPVPLNNGTPGASPYGAQDNQNLSTSPSSTNTDNQDTLGVLNPIGAGLGAAQGASYPTVDTGQAVANTAISGLEGGIGGALAGAKIGSVFGLPGAAVGGIGGGVIGLVAGGVNAYFSVKNARAQKRQQAALIAKAQARQDARAAQVRQDAIGQLAYNRRQTALQNLHLAQQNALAGMNNILQSNQDIKQRFLQYGR